MITKKINIDDVEKVYSGRKGCCCGCLGDYKDSPKAIKRMVNRFNKILDVVEEGGNHLYIESETRHSIIYLKDNKVNSYAS